MAMSTQKFEATKIRLWFSGNLEEMANLILKSEETAIEEGASGKLSISAFANNLQNMARKLESGKFRFLIIGDFNRGKSTILNALFKQKLLPMGATATTAIPTFVKYGHQKEVIVYKKNGATERLSLEDYRKNYTLNSKHVKDKVKRIFKNVEEWLDPLDFAEFYFPLDALYGGVEFVDTAGLNHTIEEDERTFSFVQSCHAIFFVLSADEQFTQKEQEYLKRFLNKKKEIENFEKTTEITIQEDRYIENSYEGDDLARPIFYLINKWENVEDEDKDEIREAFTEAFSKCLGIELTKIEQMWGESVFDVHAKTALEKLGRGEHYDNTGLDVFEERLNSFLIHERLTTEIIQAVDSAKIASTQVVEKVDDRLAILSENVESLEKKISEADPHIAVMRKIIQVLEAKTSDLKDSCINKIGKEYISYFSELVSNFERDFSIPSAHGLVDSQREEYAQNLQRQLAEYRQRKLDSWHEISKGIVLEYLSNLKDYFQDEISEYSTKREQIREILNGKSFSIEERIQISSHENFSSGDISLTAAKAGAMTKMLVGATGGVLGVTTAGIGASTAANVYAGTHILLAAGMSLTPVGWALIGAGIATGGALAWWQRRNEIQKFQDDMKKRVKKEFEKILDTSKVLNLKEKVGELFSPFDFLVDQMSNDIDSLENSFKNLIDSKKNSDINFEQESARLGKLKSDVLDQLNKIEARYESISSDIVS